MMFLGSETFNVNIKSVFLRVLPSECDTSCRTLLTYLIKLISYDIWKSRCELVYEKRSNSSKQLISEIWLELRERCQVALNTAYMDSEKSLKLFTIKNVLVSLDGDNICLNI